jgi:DNA-binding CsgD family transcriptional regulator
MARLSRSDLEAALRFAAETVEAASRRDRSDAWLLGRIASLVDAEYVAYGLIDDASRVLYSAEYPSPWPGEDADAAGEAPKPFCDYRRRTGDTYFLATRLSDLIDMDAHGRRAPEAAWGSEPVVQMRMPGPPGTHWTLDLVRSGREFTARELLFINALRPALVAYEAQRALATIVAGLQGVSRPAVPDRLLSPRERQVLDLVADGASNAEIAGRLAISPGTVKKHLENVYAKLDVGSRTGALARTGRSAVATEVRELRLALD